MDREGKKIKSFGGGSGNGDAKFSKPCGIAVTKDKFLLVSDNHKIQKVSMDGMSLASVGKKGTRSMQFNCHDSIAISPTSRLVYVVDNKNDHVQVFNPDLTFSHAFGSKGSGNGQFQSPHGIAFDIQGFVYITNKDNHRVQKFSQDGGFVAHFGSRKSGPGQLESPVGIAIDTGATGLVY
uniref:SMP-30/Gluconolactonase/LRE-like region domain-containing protein n=1 Tax=Amphimedon queenslandica TaxID=400682 RepID=A0A1X7UVB4_AMPQE